MWNNLVDAAAWIVRFLGLIAFFAFVPTIVILWLTISYPEMMFVGSNMGSD